MLNFDSCDDKNTIYSLGNMSSLVVDNCAHDAKFLDSGIKSVQLDPKKRPESVSLNDPLLKTSLTAKTCKKISCDAKVWGNRLTATKNQSRAKFLWTC